MDIVAVMESVMFMGVGVCIMVVCVEVNVPDCEELDVPV